MREPERRAQVFAQINPVLFRDGGKDLDDLRVELRPGAAPNLFARMGHRQSTAVRAVANHRSCGEASTKSAPVSRKIQGELEASYDLLRARRARRSAGLDPDVEPVIEPEAVEAIEEPSP